MPQKIQKLSSVPLGQVQFTDNFWAPKLETNREVTIPTVYKRCEETGRIAALKLGWKPGMPNEPHIFWDSDVAKWLESAAYCLTTHSDEKLEKKVDDLIDLIANAQHADGYLNTHFTVVKPKMRWKNLRDWHELYCAGHLMEAAVAYFDATGKRKFLDVVCKYADYIDTVFGIEPGRKRGYPGHQEIELALVKLYHATGNDRYLKLAKYFVDERGRQPHYFDIEATARGDDPKAYWAKTHAYTQSDIPVREQSIPTGHAVRGMYLYAAMADLAVEYNDHDLLAACKRIFEHVISKRMYITGGIGSSKTNEGYTEDYDLPNEVAYSETCAAIGLIFFADRMLQIEPHGKYADVIERALYNNVLAGVSLTGDRFFYENPLASRGNHLRWQWHHCSCCPPNLTRLLASLGKYFYSQSGDEIYVHLYAANSIEYKLADQTVRLTQNTNYPWDGNIEFKVELDRPANFTLALRIPGWCKDAVCRLNGKKEDIFAKMQDGYVKLQRNWQNGDRVELNLQMPIERVRAHPAIRQNCGRIALQRGPIVYCLEEVDNGNYLQDVEVLQNGDLKAEFEKNLLSGVVAIHGRARRQPQASWSNHLYRTDEKELEYFDFKAIPYFAWANREPGEMVVWVREIE